MNSPPHMIDPADDEQASLWAARLDDGELSPADRLGLENWLSAAPQRRALLEQYHRFSTQLDQALPALVEAGAVELPRPVPSPLVRWWPALAGAGLVAAAACVALFLRPVGPAPMQTAQLATVAAQRQSLTLADGSRIDLFARTRLSAAIGEHRREVELQGGEAFFSVARDPARPFVVRTPMGEIQVTGTRFDVRTSEQDGLEVIVAEGSVLVSPVQTACTNTAPVVLVAGSRLSIAGGRLAVDTLPASAIADALAWTEGQIVFSDTPLREALLRFARFHGRAIATGDAVADLRIGGRYALGDLDGFLVSIAELWPLEIVRNSDGSVQVGRRAGN